jgi:hypothetical protein
MVAVFRILILVPVAYAAACLAAAIVAGAVVFGGQAPEPSLLSLFLVITLLVGAWTAGIVALLPAVIGTVVAEIAGWRSWLFWVPFGTVLALFLCIPGVGLYAGLLASVHVIPTEPGAVLAKAPQADLLAVAALCGAVGGLVYWSIAGRYSGTGWDLTSSGSGPA